MKTKKEIKEGLSFIGKRILSQKIRRLNEKWAEGKIDANILLIKEDEIYNNLEKLYNKEKLNIKVEK